MSQFSHRQMADLAARYAEDSQGQKAETAYMWGNHALAGYASNLQGANADTAFGWGDHAAAGYATGAQGLKADTAFGWGDHSAAGYLASASQAIMYRSITVGAGQLSITLAKTPRGEIMAFYTTPAGVFTAAYSGTHFTRVGALVTFIGAYTPLPAGAVVDIYYSGDP
ncbi:MAG TPA: hypothetical protein VM238_19580 [Phycisphaerae bacterium]|nr:hypothetical protein [Phycisphaerae bacterium]